jgi:hypothetical protein
VLTLGEIGSKARVGVDEHEHRIWFLDFEYFFCLADDDAYCGTE